jgi:very-short-patch-repair endonuclease
MSETPHQRIIDAATKSVADRVYELIDDPDCGRGDTPIEKILYAAVAVRSRTTWFEMLQAEASHGEIRADGDNRSTDWYFVSTQVPLLAQRWRVDFVYSVRDPSSDRVSCLVVECDGHEYHERTKAQAARDRNRDRELQAAGFTIYRFTGSEIYNDPVKCADSVLEWISKTYWDYVFQRYPALGGP